MKTAILKHLKKYVSWFAIIVNLFLVITFLVSCINFDFRTPKTITNTNILSNETDVYNFASIISGQKPNPKKPINNFLNLQDWDRVQNVRFGSFENNFVGLDKMVAVFFNIFYSIKQKEFINQFNEKKLNIFKNNFKTNFFNSNIKNFEKPQIKRKWKLDDKLKKFYNEQIIVFDSNYNSNLFFNHRSNSYFIEEYFKNKKIQWEPTLKTLFSFNLLNYNFDFSLKSQDLIQQILLSIIKFSKVKMN